MIGARGLDGGTACTAAITRTIADAEQLALDFNNGTEAVLDVKKCASTAQWNVVLSYSPITVSCTASPDSNCNAVLTGCEQNVCLQQAGGGAFSKACSRCEGGTGASAPKGGTVVATSFVDGCIALPGGEVIANCDFYDITDVAKCYQCATGQAVDQNEAGCSAAAAGTNLANCRWISGTAGVCQECLQGYLRWGTGCVLALAANTTSYQTVLAASKCMGGNDTDATCTSCYNYALGTIGARQLTNNGTTNDCSEPVANVVQDCLWYMGTISRTRTAGDCGQCNGKTWMNVVTDTTVTINCSDTANDDTSPGTPTCTGTIANCAQLFCEEQTLNTTWNMGCRLCNAGYNGPSGATPRPN